MSGRDDHCRSSVHPATHQEPPPTTEAPHVPGDDVIEIATGPFHPCALIDDGTARCRGDNGSGRIGDGAASSLAPVTVVGLD